MSIILELKIIPNAKTQGIDQDSGGQLKCKIKSKPECGKANEELIKFLAKKLNISTDKIKILRGITSRNKLIKIDAQISMRDALLSLGIEIQNGL